MVRTCLEAPRGVKKGTKDANPLEPTGGQYEAFEAIFEILQCKDSETCPYFCHRYQFLCQNMSFKASNTKMMV